MPRQLPWKSTGGGGRIKPSTRQTKPTNIPDDVDDDFFDGTVFASSGKGKGKAKVASDSDDLLPGPTTESSTPRTKESKNTNSKERIPSSSPPPLADYALPRSESLRKGVSKFDLRDDEWMMVEDEFLETAKLFTRHLHIAEYDRLKESIEAKKKEAGIARPVVAGAKRSMDGAMRERAKVQDSKQKKAIRDVFACQGDSSKEDRASYRARPSRVPSATAKPRPIPNESQETDSDDLDAPCAPKAKAPPPTTMAAAKPVPAWTPRSAYLSASRPPKPALPAKTVPARPRARPSRTTPFDMLDEYTPPTSDTITLPVAASRDKPYSQSTLSNHSHPQNSRPVKPRRSVDLLDDWGPLNNGSGVSKEVADRVAKRRAERAKESDGKGRREATKLDDIPTFLF